MKINIDVDLTPQEARDFLGLPNVERIQDQMINNAEKYLSNMDSGKYEEFVKMSMQPMVAYQSWVKKFMSGGMMPSSDDDDS